MKKYDVYIDYSEIMNVEASSEEEAVKKAIELCKQNETMVEIANEAEFRAEEVE